MSHSCAVFFGADLPLVRHRLDRQLDRLVIAADIFPDLGGCRPTVLSKIGPHSRGIVRGSGLDPAGGYAESRRSGVVTRDRCDLVTLFRADLAMGVLSQDQRREAVLGIDAVRSAPAQALLLNCTDRVVATRLLVLHHVIDEYDGGARRI